MKSFISDYLKDLKKEFYLKEYEIINNSHRHIFTNKENNSFISLKDIFKKQHIIKKSLIQNEINSINEIGKDKYVIFHTSTIDPILNLSLKINDTDILESQITKQYKEFNNYFRKITQLNNDKKLNYKNIRVYELTKKLNLHCHKTDFLNNENDFIKYIESIILSRNKNKIGRVELVLDYEFFKVIEEYFKDKKIKIRVNNKYTFLTLTKKIITFKNEKQTIYIIKETEKEKGNFIYLRTIEDKKENNEHLTNYMFKYMLKSFDINSNDEILKPRSNVSKETLIFSKLKLRQKIYSINFFTDKLPKDDIEKINNKFYTLFKQEERNKKNVLNEFDKNDYNEIKNGRKHLIYTISKMLDNKKFVLHNKEEHLLNEYKRIKSLVSINLEEYNERKQKNFLSLIHTKYKENITLTEEEFNDKFFNDINDHIKHKNDLKGFIRVYNDIFDIKTIEDNDTNEINIIEINKDNELIEQISKKIFPYFVNKYNIKDIERSLYYYNDKNEKHLIHTFKSDYIFEKFSNDFELYGDLLTNKEFNNETDELRTTIDYINTISDVLNLNVDILTIDKIKEDRETEQKEKRTEENKRMIEIMDDMKEDYNDLIKFYYSLNYFEKIEFIQNNDEHLTKILRENIS